MFESLKTLWKKEQNPLQDYDQQSRQLAEEIARLEGELQRQPDNSDVQKTLMLTYNRALSVYAKSKSHPKKDAGCTKMVFPQGKTLLLVISIKWIHFLHVKIPAFCIVYILEMRDCKLNHSLIYSPFRAFHLYYSHYNTSVKKSIVFLPFF